MGSFQEFLIEDDILDTLDQMEEAEFEEIIGLYLTEEDDNLEALEEALSLAGRRKRSIAMRRLSKRMQRKKEQKLQRGVTKADIEKKARRAAINILKNKITKGRTDLSAKEKERVEDRLSKMGGAIEKIARRQLSKVKQHEKERRAAFRDAKAAAASGINPQKGQQ